MLWTDEDQAEWKAAQRFWRSSCLRPDMFEANAHIANLLAISSKLRNIQKENGPLLNSAQHFFNSMEFNRSLLEHQDKP